LPYVKDVGVDDTDSYERANIMNRKEEKYAVERLGNVPLFSGVSPKELAKLVTLCDEVVVPSGKTIVEQGSTGYECYVILSGFANVTIDGRVVATLTNGEYFGELAPLDKHPRSATVTATTDLKVLVFGPRQFASALQTVPGLSLKMLASMASRLRTANEQFAAA
jgi:CRP/FNR family transcriptional regulator, cyclic AMP receptor protein